MELVSRIAIGDKFKLDQTREYTRLTDLRPMSAQTVLGTIRPIVHFFVSLEAIEVSRGFVLMKGLVPEERFMINPEIIQNEKKG